MVDLSIVMLNYQRVPIDNMVDLSIVFLVNVDQAGYLIYSRKSHKAPSSTLVFICFYYPNWWLTYPPEKSEGIFIELDDGEICRKALYLMVKTMVSCKFSLKPIQWYMIWLVLWNHGIFMKKPLPSWDDDPIWRTIFFRGVGQPPTSQDWIYLLVIKHGENPRCLTAIAPIL